LVDGIEDIPVDLQDGVDSSGPRGHLALDPVEASPTATKTIPRASLRMLGFPAEMQCTGILLHCLFCELKGL
jgi:hypothetical protein